MTGKPATEKRTRIQVQNEARIIAAALDVFAANGFRGATVDQIAHNAGMSKANVLTRAATQHYADFQPQIEVLYDGDTNTLFDAAEHTLKLTITRGLAP